MNYGRDCELSLGPIYSVSLLECMAGTTGLEPATSAVTGQRSNQLSYVPQLLRRIPYCITLIPRGLGKHRTIWAG
jgi:hypothetical protein